MSIGRTPVNGTTLGSRILYGKALDHTMHGEAAGGGLHTFPSYGVHIHGMDFPGKNGNTFSSTKSDNCNLVMEEFGKQVLKVDEETGAMGGTPPMVTRILLSLDSSSTGQSGRKVWVATPPWWSEHYCEMRPLSWALRLGCINLHHACTKEVWQTAPVVGHFGREHQQRCTTLFWEVYSSLRKTCIVTSPYKGSPVLIPARSSPLPSGKTFHCHNFQRRNFASSMRSFFGEPYSRGK